MIYLIGNSHVNLYTNSNPGDLGISENKKYKKLCIRPMEVEGFVRHWSTMIDFFRQSKPNDLCIPMAGEHDCRMANDLTEIKPLVDKFFTILLNLKFSGFNVAGYSSHPSNHVMFTREWDLLLGEKCKKSEIPYVSIVDLMVRTDSTLKKELYLDDVHLNDKALSSIEQRFREKVIDKF